MKQLGLNPQNPMVAVAVFGQQVQDFLTGPIGSYLMTRSETRLAILIKELKEAPPVDHSLIQSLQIEIRYLENFQAWLGDAVADGLLAIKQLEAEGDNG